MEDKEVSSDKVLLSLMPKATRKEYKASSTNVNLADRYNKLQIVLSKHTLLFRLTTSRPITIRNQLSAYLIAQLKVTKKSILTCNSHKPLSHEDVAAIVRNEIKNICNNIDTCDAKFQ